MIFSLIKPISHIALTLRDYEKMDFFSIKKLFITFALIIAFYSILVFYSDVTPIIQNYHSINLIFLAYILPLFIISTIVRTLIQKNLLTTLGIKLSLKQNYLIFLAGLSMLITPGGGGQIIKSILIKEKFSISISKSIPIVLVERFYDLFAISIYLTTFSIIIFYQPSFVIGFFSFLIVIFTFIIMKKNSLVFFFLEKLSKFKFTSKFLQNYHDTQKSLKLLFESKIVVKCSSLILFSYFIESLIIYFGFSAMNVDLGYVKSLEIFYSSVLIGIFSFIPGGLGLTETSLIGFLVYENYELSESTATAIFLRFITLWISVIVGFVVLGAYFADLFKK